MKNNNVKVLSVSTISTIVLSTIIMLMFSIFLTVTAGYAKEIGDEFGGPGIGLADSTWNGTITNRIYAYGDLNGIIGDEIVAGKAYSSDGPTNYVVYDDTNPIDHSLIDMGPTSAKNYEYSLLSINDGGPGMNVTTNAFGIPQIYNDGGPGFMVSGLTKTENIKVDNGPIVVESNANPMNYWKYLNMKPGDFTFNGGTREDKLGK